MVQDIEPYQFYNAYRNIKPEEEDYVLCFRGNALYMKANDREILEFPKAGAVRRHILSFCRREEKARAAELAENLDSCFPYLFSIDDKKYFLLREQLLAGMLERHSAEDADGIKDKAQSLLGQCLPEKDGWQFVHTGNYRYLEPLVSVFAGGVGGHLHRWYETHIYCGSCASPFKPSQTERALVCPRCGMIEYPRISPAVIIGITKGDKILMTKYAPGHGGYRKYALVAGYVEVGETLEDTVRREVMEEVGLQVRNIRYYGSQPWPFDGAVLAGFFAEVDGSDEITLEERELAEATWFSREEMPPVEVRLSLTNEMIDIFRRGKNI